MENNKAVLSIMNPENENHKITFTFTLDNGNLDYAIEPTEDLKACTTPSLTIMLANMFMEMLYSTSAQAENVEPLDTNVVTE